MQKQSAFYLYGIAFIVSIGGMLYGYDIGVISGALLFIQDSIPLNEHELGRIVGAVLAGALLGTVSTGWLADRYGRRLMIMLAALFSLLGVAVTLIAANYFTLLIARLLLGIGVGIVAVAVPLYVAEIVPAKSRGKYMTCFQLFLTFGIVLANIVNLSFAPTRNWQAMFAIGLIPALVLFLGMLNLPESPRFLLARHNKLAANAVLSKILASPAAIEAEIAAIEASLHSTTHHWRELFAYKYLLFTLVAVLVAICNQLTGINVFLQYAPLILKQAGIESDALSLLGSLSIGCMNFLCTILAILLIDTIGRRPLLLFGLLGVVSAECFLGIIPYLSVTPAMQGSLSLIGLLIFIFSFAIGPGVVVWLAIAELFPTPIRGKGVALCLFFNSLAGTLLATYFLPLTHILYMSQTYWLFAGCSLLYLFVSYLFLPETKAKTLEEIQSIRH